MSPKTEGTTCVSLHGHLFDTGLINKAFDLLEENHARFHLLHCEVHPNLRAKVDILKRLSIAYCMYTMQ